MKVIIDYKDWLELKAMINYTKNLTKTKDSSNDQWIALNQIAAKIYQIEEPE